MTAQPITLDTSDKSVKAIVANIRSDVRTAQHYLTYVTTHGVTRDNVAQHAAALATLAYPNDKPVQKTDGKRTRFGNAVQAAAKGMRAHFEPEVDEDAPIVLLTRDGKAADLADVIAAWEAAQRSE